MVESLIYKALLCLFVLSCLVTIRHAYYFTQALMASNDEDIVKYRLSPIALLYLGLAISYIIMTLITGFRL
jgi:hypothetical protein